MSYNKRMINDKTAVILSGGLGTRLQPFTYVIPKPLLPIGEKAVLEVQIEKLKKYGFNNIILATNYKGEYIENFFGDGKRYGVNLTISKEEKPLGTAGPIKLIEDKLSKPFLVMNGDILTLLNFDKFYNYAINNKAALTVGIKKIIMPYAFGNISFNGDRVTNIEEKPEIITYALAGVYIMTPQILKYIPDGRLYGMDSLIKDLLAKDEIIKKYEIEDYWLDIGRSDDYEKAQGVEL